MNSLITIETNFLNSENLIAIILVILVLMIVKFLSDKDANYLSFIINKGGLL